MLNIEAAQYYVPSKFVDLTNMTEFCGLSRQELKVFTRVYGLENIPSGEGMRLHDLLCAPIKALLQQNYVDRNNIKLVIYAHTSEILMPFSQSIVRWIKKEFNFDCAVSFAATINNCASTLSALEVADHYLRALGADAKALIITGELTFTPVQKVIPGVSLLGDAAAVMLVGRRNGFHRLLAIETKVDGSSAGGVWMTREKNRQYELDYAPALSGVIKAALTKAKIGLSHLTAIFPHNVNLPSWQAVAKCLGLPIEKIYLQNVRRYSHCFGADIVINFLDAVRAGVVKPGDYYMMVTVGLGSVYSAAVFQY